MSKIRDLVKRRPYAVLNAAGILIVLLCFFAEPVARIGFGIAFAAWLFTSELIMLICAAFIVAAVNAFAFISVKNNEPIFGILFTALGGFIGGFAAVHTVNKGYAKVRAVNLIFNGYVWLILYALAAFLLYRLDYYYFPLFKSL